MRLPFSPRALGAIALAIAEIASFTAARDASAAGLPSVAVHRTEDTSGCPDARRLAGLVAQQMKRPALEPAPDGASARTGAGLDIQIYRSEEGFTAVLLSGTKTRTISDRGATCAGLADALAISIAVLLDTDPPPVPPDPPAAPSAVPERREPRVPVVEEPRAPIVETPKPPPAPVEVPTSLPEVRSFHVSFAFAGVVTDGLLRPLGAGIAGEVEIRIGRFSISGGVLGLPGQTINYPTGAFPTGQVDVALTVGFVRACGTVLGNGDAQRLALCAAPVAGAIRGEGQGYTNPRAVTLPWVGASASALYQQRIWGPLAWGSRVTFFVPFTRHAFQIDNVGKAFTPAPVGGALEAELRVTIW